MIETQHSGMTQKVLSGIPEYQTLSMLTQLVAAMRARQVVDERAIGQRYVLGEIEIDEHMRMVLRAGVEVKLTPKEYDLLIALARRHGAPASKQALMLEVWNTTAETDSRTLDQHVFELRRKLEKSSRNPVHLLTVRKFGYRLRPA